MSILFSKVFSMVAPKLRLYIEYALIAVIIVLAVFVINLWLAKTVMTKQVEHLNSELVNQKQTVQLLQKSNEANIETIHELKNLRGKDAEAIQDLVTNFKSLADSNKKVDIRLKTLEQNNEAVREYLRSDIPAPLKCLLDNTCRNNTH